MFGKIDGNVLTYELCDIIGDLKKEPLTVGMRSELGTYKIGDYNWLPIINLQPTPVKDVWEMTPNYENLLYLQKCDIKLPNFSDRKWSLLKLCVPEIGWVWNVEYGKNGNWFGLVEGWESERGNFTWDEILKLVIKNHYSLYITSEWYLDDLPYLSD